MGELSWAAGFFDGEGTAWFPRGAVARGGNRRARLHMRVSQVEREPLFRFHAAVCEVGTVGGPHDPISRRGKSKPISYWQASGRDAGKAASLLWTHLCEPKRAQIKEALRMNGEFNRSL